MYRAKERTKRKIPMEALLKRGIQCNGFSYVYQPIYNVRWRRFTRAEILMRMGSGRAKIFPAYFIPVAECCQMIGAMGEMVLEEACAKLSAFQEKGIVLEKLNVNVSPIQLEDKQFVSIVYRMLQSYAICAGQLTLEITESGWERSSEIVTKNLQRMEALGIGVALDDFGNGYNSLSCLLHVAFGEIKIDKQLVDEVEHNIRARRIIESVVHLARSLGGIVTAEGVETKAQFEILITLGCDYLQGFFLSRPVTKDGLERILSKVKVSKAFDC